MKLGEQELIDQLRIKIKSLGKLSIEFDNGDHESAIEISTIIRVIIHDTSNSSSLLNQLDKKNIKILNTSDGIFKFNNTLPQYSLVKSIINPTEGIYYYPFLENSLIYEYIPFQEWWDEIVVYVPQQNINIKRKDLVLKLANKYGAHIGTDIPRYYHDLFTAKDHMIGFTWIKNSRRTDHLQTPLFPSIRQISHELIVSLRENFKEVIDFDELYFNKLNPSPNRISGVSGMSFGGMKKSDSLIQFEKLTNEEKNEPVQLSEDFIEKFHKIYPELSLKKLDLIQLLEQLQPYQLTDSDLLMLCKNFRPYFESYKNDILTKLKSEFNIDGIGILRTSVWMNNDDFFIDEDPPHDWKVLRNKYNKLIKTAYNNGEQA